MAACLPLAASSSHTAPETQIAPVGPTPVASAAGGSGLAQRDDELAYLKGLLGLLEEAKKLTEESDGKAKELFESGRCLPLIAGELDDVKKCVHDTRCAITTVHRHLKLMCEARGKVPETHLLEEDRLADAGPGAEPRDRSRSPRSCAPVTLRERYCLRCNQNGPFLSPARTIASGVTSEAHFVSGSPTTKYSSDDDDDDIERLERLRKGPLSLDREDPEVPKDRSFDPEQTMKILEAGPSGAGWSDLDPGLRLAWSYSHPRSWLWNANHFPAGRLEEEGLSPARAYGVTRS
jgi:hypothetical protein